MAQATNSTQGEILLAGDLFGDNASSPQLVATGVSTIVNPTTVGKIHVDAKGRLTWQGKGDYVADLMPIAPSASKSEKGICEIGYNINVSAGVISLPVGSSANKGVVQIGSGLSVSSGTVNLNTNALPVASAITSGKVIVGTGLVVTNGILSFPGAANATTTSKGVVQPGSNFGFSNGSISVAETSKTEKGLMQFGLNLLATNGVIQIRACSPFILGRVFGVDANQTALNISDGVISFNQNNLPIASADVAGMVKPGAGFAISPDGALSISTAGDATTTSKGTIQAGGGFSVTNGILSLALQDATSTTKGAVQVNIDNGLSINSGALDISKSEDSSNFGVIKSRDVNNIVIANGAMDVGTNIAKLNSMNVYSKAQTSSLGLVTYAASTNYGLSMASRTLQITLTGNVTIASVANLVPGAICTVIWKQDAIGGRTLSLNNSIFKTNQTITLSTAPNAMDIMTFICKDANTVYVLFAAGY